MNSKKLPRKKNASAMRMLGGQLGAARRAAGLTQRALAERLKVDEETIASIEQGRRTLKPDLAELLDRELDTKGVLAAGVDNLPEVDQFPLWAELYAEHAREAICLSWYEPLVVPGLLQTEAYARAVFRNRVPAFTEEEVESKTADRMSRQDILHRKSPPTLGFVVWEPVLHLSFGGSEVHRQQLAHLRKMTEIPAVALQFLPIDSPYTAGLSGAFIIIETEDHQHLAYTESQQGSQWVSDPDKVSVLAQKYAMLRTQALNPQDSVALLDRLLGDR